MKLDRFAKNATGFFFAAALAFGAVRLLAADPKPAEAAPAAGSSLTVEQLGDALDTFDKSTTTVNGHTDYSINVKRGKWTINVIISESPNGTVIWMTNSLTQMPEPGKTSTDALIDVLKKNTEVGPLFFSIAHGSLRLSYPVPNYNLTPESLKAKVEELVSTVVQTETLWNTETLSGAKPAIK